MSWVSDDKKTCIIDITKPTGSITITSIPSGAEIFIDGVDQGVKTDSTVTDIPAGDHTFTLKLAGYKDFTGTLQVVEDQITNIAVTLESAKNNAAMLLGLTIFGMGVLGAVVLATREKKPEYTVPGYKGG